MLLIRPGWHVQYTIERGWRTDCIWMTQWLHDRAEGWCCEQEGQLPHQQQQLVRTQLPTLDQQHSQQPHQRSRVQPPTLEQPQVPSDTQQQQHARALQLARSQPSTREQQHARALQIPQSEQQAVGQQQMPRHQLQRRQHSQQRGGAGQLPTLEQPRQQQVGGVRPGSRLDSHVAADVSTPNQPLSQTEPLQNRSNPSSYRPISTTNQPNPFLDQSGPPSNQTAPTLNQTDQT